MFLRCEAQSVDQFLHLRFRLLDLFADLDFLLSCQQGNLAHLVHVHPDGVVQNLKPGILFLLLLSGFGTFHLGGVDNFDIQIPQLCIKLVQIIRRHPIGEDVVDVVVGHMAVFMGQVEEGFDDLSQIHGRGWG